MASEWNPMVPELVVADLVVSVRFYRMVGFTVRFERTEPPFAYLELGLAQLMLEQEHGGSWVTGELLRPLGRGVNFQIEVPAVEPIAAALAAVGQPLFRPIRESWYAVSESEEEGQQELLVQDPDGYLLRFVQVLGARPLSPQVQR